LFFGSRTILSAFRDRYGGKKLPEGRNGRDGTDAAEYSGKAETLEGIAVKTRWKLNLDQNSQKVLAGILCVQLVALVGVIDYQTGYELAFSLFYLIPICLATWVSGRDLGLLVSILGACAWYLADVLSGHVYSSSLIYLWNTGIRLGMFAVVTFVLAGLRESLNHERNLSRTDHLTGAVNTRAFLELIQSEINRLERYQHSFTVVYIDLDNFKSVNDRYGHLVGDKVLQAIVANIRKRLRKTDTIGRLGGDEFALLLPETGQDAAQVVVKIIHAGVSAAMQLRKLPVTASMGVVTCQGIPPSAETLIKSADELMYSIKNHGKDGIGYSIFGG
jgi:diguanylate cyclase (GGDEF)-like protein